MNKAQAYDFGHYCAPAYSSISTLTAGGTGDNTEVTGATVDRQYYGSAAVCIAYTATLAATKTISFAVTKQESADGSTWDTATTVQAATVADTGAAGGSTETGVVKFAESFETSKRYVRYNVTPDLSATSTDTASVAVTVVLGGVYNGASLPVA